MLALTCIALAVPMAALNPGIERAAVTAPPAQVTPYAEALAEIREKALFDTSDLPRSVTADTLKTYVAGKDRYGDFLTPEEYARWRGSSRRMQGAIGMDIERRPNGDVLGFPYPDSPAARAGIRSGDRVLAIDGISTRDRALPTLAAAARGPAYTMLSLEIAGADGRMRRLRIQREHVQAPRPRVRVHGGFDVIEIPSFTPSTRFDLATLLAGWKAGRPVVIDLRGNFGGDFYAAVDSAMLFVPEGERIASLRMKNGSKQYDSTLTGARPQRRVILWQDEGTASAAELFIAALTENGRATSIGRKTFGKGTRQDVIELADGAALILTTAYLRTPKGTEFNGRGLLPNEEVGPGAGTAAYVAGTARVSSSRLGGGGRLRLRPQPEGAGAWT